VILYFQSPKSYTGEDILELQLHGGNAIVKSVLNALMKTHAPEQGYFVRYAEAGEFSKRAFQNGVLDLTQVEGIRDSIDAETETQRKAAMAPASGRMKIMYDDWRKQIVDTMALLTALIDFSEDSDITSARELFEQSRDKVNQLLSEINDHYKVIKRSELLVSGIRLDFLGPPNAGKSYLLNRLAERDAAIVSDVPGTTRDVLELSMDISGYKVVLGDTAGLRSVSRKCGLVVKESTDDLNYKIELEGMKRAKQRFKNSDIVLCILPLSQNPTSVSISPDVLAEIKDLQNLNKRIIVALNKEDLVDSAVSLEDVITAYANTLQVPRDDILSVSCLTEKGITDLVQKLVSNFENMTIDTSSQGYPIGASQRTKDILQNEVVAGLEGFLAIEDETEVVIATEELRFAAEGIGKITGQGVGVEEVLGVVFSSFCIGK
jgi:tRNA modification GTPase